MRQAIHRVFDNNRSNVFIPYIILAVSLLTGGNMQAKLGRTLSTPDRSNDDVAKEIFLSNKRNELDEMMNNGDITEFQAQTIGDAINHYVQFNGGKTRGGFERGLTQLIEMHLRDLSQTGNTLFVLGN